MIARVGLALAALLGLGTMVDAAAPPALLSAVQQQQLEERNRWVRRAQARLAAGEIDGAITAFGQALAVERAVYGNVHSLGLLEKQAGLLERREQFAKALATWEEVLRLEQQLYGQDDWRVIDSRLNLLYCRQLAVLTSKQRQRLRQALAWNAQVVRLWKQGRSKEALPLAEKALAIRREVLGEKHRAMALSWFNLGAQHEALHHFPEALRCYGKALAIRKEVLGVKHPLYASSLNNLALLYQTMGDHQKALPLLQQALHLRKAALGEKHPQYADSLNNLGKLCKDTGEYGKALTLFVQALQLRKEVLGTKHPHYAQSLNNLAVLYQNMGDCHKALPLYRQACRLRKEVLGEKHPDYATGLDNLAGLYHEMGDYRKALPLYEQVRHLVAAALGEKHPFYAHSLGNLAMLYQDMGDDKKALPLCQQALHLRREVLGEKHPAYALNLNNLASLYQSMGEYHKALPLLQQALTVRKEVLGEKHPHYAQSLNNLANLYQVIEEPDKALALFEQARHLYKQVLGGKHPECAINLNNLARIYHARGEYAKALPLYEQALDIYRSAFGAKHSHCANSLNNLALLYRDMGRPAAAAVLVGQALAIEQAQQHDTFAVLSERQRRAVLERGENLLGSFLSVAQDLTPASELYGWVALSKGALAARAAEERLARDEPELQPLLLQLRQARANLARLGGQNPAPAGMAEWQKRFDERERRKEHLQTLLASRSARFARLRQKPTARRVQQALPPRTALVEFLSYQHLVKRDPKGRGWLLERRLLAFVLRPNPHRGRVLGGGSLQGAPSPVLVRLGEAWAIERALAALRLLAIPTAGRSGSAEAALLLLRRQLWEPIEKHLAGIDTVLIAPEGVLEVFPFCALPGRKAGTFLVEDYTIGYLQSGRQLLDPVSPAQKEARGLLALGDADFGKPAGKGSTGWSALPGTAVESQTVETLFRKHFAKEPTRHLAGARADRARLLRAVDPRQSGQPWRYLHLATHGFFSPGRRGANPAVLGGWAVGGGAAPGWAGLCGALTGVLLASEPGALDRARGFDPSGRTARLVQGNPMVLTGLVLAGANRSGHEATLTAEEIADLDLRGTELAVLSACRTALGHLSGWQGMQGLPTAFHQAGATNVLTSLWSVSDPATSVLMEQFYVQLWQHKQRPLQALRQAQLFVLNNPKSVQQRTKELRDLLVNRGIAEEVLAQRGIGKQAGLLPAGAEKAKRSPVAWWTPWVLSGRP
jgi:tetratricopeptide (TPR) repeat protein/CHAT domain-containing protein